MPERNLRPTRKVGAGTLGAALGTIVAIVIQAAWPDLSVTGLEGALAAIFGFMLSYVVPERAVS